MLRSIALLLCLTSVAHADSEMFFGIPIELGATTREDGRVFYGIRPEVLFSREGTRGPAFGGYGELARSSGDTSVGAGVTATYLWKWINLAPSAGVVYRDAVGYSVGAFFGYRATPDWGGLDSPVGIRVDYRADADHDELVICAQVDVAALLLKALFGGYSGVTM